MINKLFLMEHAKTSLYNLFTEDNLIAVVNSRLNLKFFE